MATKLTRRARLRGLAAALPIFLAGCAVAPTPLDEQVTADRAASDLAFIDEYRAPVTGPISMAEAMARALKYNLDYRLEWRNKVLSETELDIARYEMLPRFVAEAGIDSRDNYSAAFSTPSPFDETDERETNFATSQERTIRSAELELAFSTLDFGVSYYRARQAANAVMIAEEEKRKVIHRLLQNVRTVYWRAVSARRLADRMGTLKGQVEDALTRSDNLVRRGVSAPLQQLRYRREMIDITRQIQELEENFRVARIQLAALMNLRPGEDYDIVVPDRDTAIPNIDLPLDQLETIALQRRPEIRQVDYRKRSAVDEARASMASLLPGIDLYAGSSWNSNSFVFNNQWLSAGARVSWDLLNILRYPATQRRIEAESELLDARSLTLSMAILTQVHVSLAQYAHSVGQLATQRRYFDTQAAVDRRVGGLLRSGAIGRQEGIRETMNTLLSDVRYDVAVANAQSAYANVVAAVGMDKSIDSPESMSVEALAAVLSAE